MNAVPSRTDVPARPVPGPGAGLRGTVRTLTARNACYEALSRAAASGGGEHRILRTLHEQTGFPTLTEDRFGHVRDRAGPVPRGLCSPGPRGPGARPREELLDRPRRGRGAGRDRDRLVAPVEMAGDPLGLVALVDPDRLATETDVCALVQTALTLAPALSHERRLAELEPQLRHDLVEQLISGEAGDDVLVHAAALGHDLSRPHRAVVLRWPRAADGATLGGAVVRAAGHLGQDVLVGARGATTVALLSDPDAGPDPGDGLYRAVAEDLGTTTGAVGVGSRCRSFTELPQSYDGAVRALTFRRRSQDPCGSTSFEALGLCRMMGTGDGEREADVFVRQWLGALLDYDAVHHTDLVVTLSHYLESGGGYDATAAALLIHRSTVRYRLQRIREITGHDLGVVETRLNLHVATRIRNVLGEP